MKKVRVQEIVKDGETYHIIVSDVEFGGTIFQTITLKEAEYNKNSFFEGSILYVKENDEGTITSAWMMTPVFHVSELEANDDEGYFI